MKLVTCNSLTWCVCGFGCNQSCALSFRAAQCNTMTSSSRRGLLDAFSWILGDLSENPSVSRGWTWLAPNTHVILWLVFGKTRRFLGIGLGWRQTPKNQSFLVFRFQAKNVIGFPETPSHFLGSRACQSFVHNKFESVFVIECCQHSQIMIGFLETPSQSCTDFQGSNVIGFLMFLYFFNSFPFQDVGQWSELSDACWWAVWLEED